VFVGLLVGLSVGERLGATDSVGLVVGSYVSFPSRGVWTYFQGVQPELLLLCVEFDSNCLSTIILELCQADEETTKLPTTRSFLNIKVDVMIDCIRNIKESRFVIYQFR
jgi:hypothetical protein